MKKLVALSLVVFIFFSLTACKDSTTSVNLSIPDDITEASVSHIVSGQESQWIIGGNDIPPLNDWLSRLQCEQGNKPEDSEGGEVYFFAFDGRDDLNFSYVNNGENGCYLVVNETWYYVSNPADPPVTFSNDIDALLRPYQEVLDRLNEEHGYGLYIPEDKKESVYEAYKNMTPEEFETEMIKELEEETSGRDVSNDSEIIIGDYSNTPEQASSDDSNGE